MLIQHVLSVAIADGYRAICSMANRDIIRKLASRQQNNSAFALRETNISPPFMCAHSIPMH